MTRAYEVALGDRLRAVRMGRRWTLQQVQARSGGLLNARTLGSYERADRPVLVDTLPLLAAVYGCTAADLLPDVAQIKAQVAVDLRLVDALPAGQGGALARYAHTVSSTTQFRRRTVVYLLPADLDNLAHLYRMSPAALLKYLHQLGVILPEEPKSE